MAASVKQDPKFLNAEEVPSNTLVFREFQGVNVASPRQSIGDEQFAWMENFMPLAPGNLPVMNVPAASGVVYNHACIYECTANISGVDYIFSFLSDGSAFYSVTGSAVSTSFAAAGTFTAPYAISFTSTAGAAGLLIIDPSKGYFDFGVTTALTLTKISSTLSTPIITNPGGGYTAAPTIGFTGGGGSGATAQAFVGVRSATLAAAGTNYLVGDLLNIVGGTGNTTAVLSVSTVGAGGAITGFSIQTQGTYTTLPANPAAVTGGAGTGATFTLTWGLTSIVLTNPGVGYVSAPTFTGLNSSGGTGASATISFNGTLTGNSLASYAGRVWVAQGKSVSFTDVSSYNSFGGAGGQFTINDSYLHNNINALYSANGYMYIFGDDSIDLLSNVQVSGGVTSFSRTNITSSVGTNFGQSIFPYYRSLFFGNGNGFYSLSGATPEKISDDLDGLFKSSVFVGGMVAGAVSIFGVLCMAWLVRIVDTFTTLYGTGVTRTLLVIYYKKRWFFAYPGFDFTQIASVPGSNSTASLYGVATGGTPKLYQLFAANNSVTTAFAQTKLWDGGVPIQNKDLLRAGLGIIFGASVNRTLTVTTDNEFGSTPVTQIGSSQANRINFVNNVNGVLQFVNNANQALNFFGEAFSYSLEQGTSNTNGGKYFGMSVTVMQTDVTLPLFAVQYRNTMIW